MSQGCAARWTIWRRGSRAFQDMLAAYFDKWALSESEREGVLLLLKGCTIAEIAQVRGTADGTVKAQTNSIYKKSGYANKTQLLSSFIEDLTFGESVSSRAERVS